MPKTVRRYADEENAVRVLEKLEWRPEGTLSWEFDGHKINYGILYETSPSPIRNHHHHHHHHRSPHLHYRPTYDSVAEGLDKPGTPLVLIHGFGASAFHWRYNVPALAKERPVYVGYPPMTTIVELPPLPCRWR